MLDPTTGGHEKYQEPAPIEFVEKMKQLHHVGRYGEALKVLAEARGADAGGCCRVVLGYVSYALNRVGEVAASSADVDTIMLYGFNWAPPTAIVDSVRREEHGGDAAKAQTDGPRGGRTSRCSLWKNVRGRHTEHGWTFFL